jgi:sulfoxide reductase heme-binding subunit YedZ
MIMSMLKNLKKWGFELLDNSRFWVLATGIVLSLCIAGFVQLFVPSGILQIIRIEQAYGFISILLLFLALFASPFTKVYPKVPFNRHYLHVRRALGVLTFYYAFLHAYLTFFNQLGGFSGIQYYNSRYGLAMLLGVVALVILFFMAITSLDWAVRVLSFTRWKLLHRLVYVAFLCVLIHVALIGAHYDSIGVLSVFTATLVVVLVVFELLRIRINLINKNRL